MEIFFHWVKERGEAAAASVPLAAQYPSNLLAAEHGKKSA
jgi:hypothetical protein